jgi:hypothetical protein
VKRERSKKLAVEIKTLTPPGMVPHAASASDEGR